jgi:two-component system CheB/CheR fusion protein
MLLEGVRLLLAEDDDDLRDVLAESLQEMGALVTTSVSGDEGLAKFSGDPESYDVIISDMRMPAGDGLEFARGVQSLRNERQAKGLPTPTLFFVYSGYNDVEPKDWDAAGVSEVFVKPFALEQMAGRISDLIRFRASA